MKPDRVPVQDKTADYLEVTYSESRLPLSQYPQRLTDWLITNVFHQPGILADIGCGRGEYLTSFARRGFSVVGVDSAASAQLMADGYRVEIADVERSPIPIADNAVDYVYSKSVIEHLHHPNTMLSECRRILRPGGTAVIMTPSWRHQRHVFYEDYTHVTPFTANGLADAMTVAGFADVDVRLFWQLPVLWRYPWLHGLIKVISYVPVTYRPWDPAPWPDELNKLIRFSKEVMLLGVGVRPAIQGRR
jgi:SAM-dependent methyltransferase